MALYSAKIPWRKVGPGASKTTSMRPGAAAIRSFSNMLVTPKTALVGKPLEVERFRMAWKARKM